MGETSPKLLDLMIPKERDCLGVVGIEERKNQNGSLTLTSSCDEKKLELKLGLPCEEDWQNKQQGVMSFREKNYFNGGGGGFSSSCYGYQTGLNNGKVQMSVMGKDVSQPCYVRISEFQDEQKKAFSHLSANNNNTAVTNTSQKRAAPTPVVGWPPIRSFRKNLASSSPAKASAEQPRVIPSKSVNEKQSATENSNKGLFVKINMDGVPIGRKVDLHACNCYKNLSSAVDPLFRGLLTALKDSSGGGTENKKDEQKPITGLLDGTGEYTLVYEDNEGDRMLAGDVPWHMFVSTVKRLRVLKTSDLPTLFRGSSNQGKVTVESASK